MSNIFMNNPYDEEIRELFFEHGDIIDQFGLEPEPKRIEHKSYDGFIPYTNGGWSLMVIDDLSQVNSSGDQYAAAPQALLDQAIDYSLDCAINSFIDDNLDTLEKIYGTNNTKTLKDIVSYHDLYERDEGKLAEKFSEAEHNSLSEGGEFWAVLRAIYFSADNSSNESGEDEIYFHAGVNTDFTHGRDSGLLMTFERTIKVSELVNISLAELVNEMRNSLYPAS